MKKIYSLIISSTLLLNGCGVFGGGEDSATIPEIPTPTPTPTPTPEVTETPDNGEVIGSTGGLIPATNPQDRLRQIEQGRNNPFNSISPPAVIKIRQDQPLPFAQEDRAIVRTPVPVAVTPSAPTKMTQNNSSRATKNGEGNTANRNNPPASGNVVDMAKIQANAPVMPPNPTEASNMRVSGVMNLDGNNIALVQAPWESVPKSVRVGDIISNGNVNIRVREIRFNYPTSIALLENNQTVYRNIGNDQGFVVFEQYGQRVTKEIGNTPQETDKVAKL
jgi:hypothetical protein